MTQHARIVLSAALSFAAALAIDGDEHPGLQYPRGHIGLHARAFGYGAHRPVETH